MVGYHVNFDVGMINGILKKHNLPKILNKKIDIAYLCKKSKHTIYQNIDKQYTLDNLCDELNISKSVRHTASGDACKTASAISNPKSTFLIP